MNLYIGKLQNDGVVRYIALPYEEQYNDVPRILGTSLYCSSVIWSLCSRHPTKNGKGTMTR